MAAILSLRPNVTRAEAIEAFRGGLLGWMRGGSLRSVADAYVPFHLYEVETSTGGACHTSWFALDAVSGTLDPYQFDRPPGEAELVRIDTHNRPQPLLDDDRGRGLLEDKLRRVVFQTGFFRVRNLRFRAERVPLGLHVPYWLGFFGAGESLRLRVLDAVRRRFEGAKARALFETWLAGA